MIKPEDVPSLNDGELMKVLKQAGLNKGPITSTTRSLYEKKLMKFLQQSKLPENMAPMKAHAEKTLDKTKPNSVEPLKESNKKDSVHTNSPMQAEKKPKQNRPIRTLIQPDDEPVGRTSNHKMNQNQMPDLAKRSDYGTKLELYGKKIEPAQEKIIYPSVSQKSQSVYTPPLDMQRNRNPPETLVLKGRSETNSNCLLDKWEKKDPRSASTKFANSTLPLEFKLINNEEKNTSLSERYIKEDRPFLGFIRTDRHATQTDYLLNKRSIVKIDQSIPMRQLNKSPEFNSQPLVDLSPQLELKAKNETDQVSSSITVTKLKQDQKEHSDWIRENFKYLLSVFLITIIVYYCLQATEEDNIVL